MFILSPGHLLLYDRGRHSLPVLLQSVTSVDVDMVLRRSSWGAPGALAFEPDASPSGASVVPAFEPHASPDRFTPDEDDEIPR